VAVERTQDHLVYFIRAGRQRWVKIGRSRDVMTLDSRFRSIAGREPFTVTLEGVSSVITEKEAHEKLATYWIRSEWFWWRPEVKKFMVEVCDVYRRRGRGDDTWGEIVFSEYCRRENAKVEGRNRRLREALERDQGESNGLESDS